MVELRELIRLMSRSSVNELTFVNNGVRFYLKKSPSLMEKVEQKDGLNNAGEMAIVPNVNCVKSLFVGRFSNPFIQVGDVIQVGQKIAVCQVEALRLSQEMKTTMAGVVVEWLVQDGEIIEYGQPLLLVKELKGEEIT
ncbi:acetyl-CoA carboxylase biotin carboxyl carrier protein [Alkalihalobacillus sp. 1P02AB]|uniref:acetyl-CoA carboxylase biotin carboxyl carrier protein n=1 Tax=Alkalihalobacillus sp. 1P02AB TaxID=3132260 RepID=UPI0039A40E05